MSQNVFSGDRGDYEEEEEVDLEGEEDTLRLFMGLLHKEASQRCSYLSHLTRSVQLWLRRRREDMTADKLLSIHMPSILRISLTCPFQDVREQLSSVLKFAKVRATHEGVCVCVCAGCFLGDVFSVCQLPIHCLAVCQLFLHFNYLSQVHNYDNSPIDERIEMVSILLSCIVLFVFAVHNRQSNDN